MKAHTTGFKNAVKELGRQLRAVITYGNVTLEEEIYAVTPHFEGGLLKSIMKQLDLELSVDIPIETVINCQIGILVNGNYEMLNYGNYVVYKSEKQEDTNTYKLTCYDKMLYSMKQNEDLGITYPISIKNYLKAVLRKIGLTLKTTTFQNESRMIQNELYLGLEYTYRDILDEIAQATGSIICLNENDEVLVKYPTKTNDTIDEEFLKDVNIDFGQMYGAINTIVLSRSGESDNIYYPPELPENPIEIKIKDNQIMNWNDRSDYLQGIYNALNGLYYYINDFSSTGILYYEVGDLYNIQVGENTYQCLMLNDEINITTGIEEIIHTDLPEQSETDYTKADKTDRKINQTYLIVDKQNQKIESVVSNVNSQNNKISQLTQTVDELSSRISDIADITTSGESMQASVQLSNINQSEPIELIVHPITQNISYLYPRSNLYPSSSLYLTTRTIRFVRTYDDNGTTRTQNIDYILPDDLLYYDSENYDEFILNYDSHTCQVRKKCKYNADGTVGLLSSEVVTDYTYPTIQLEDGDYQIKILNYNIGYLSVRLMAQNIYTTQFATRAELHSDIKQTVDDINLSVGKKLEGYSTTTEMNSAIDVKANAITSSVSETYATKSELSSSASSLNSKIDQTAKNISLTVGSVEEKAEMAQSTADNAVTKADNAQSSANSAQNTANSINNNLTTNYYTKTQTNSAINQKADSITSTVSQTYSTKTETTAAKNAAINSANASTDTKLQSYSTTTQMNTAIEQKANQITSTVSQTYSTKTETSNAIDAIEIGARNYFVGTGTLKNLEVNKASGYGTYDPYSTSENKTLLQLGFNVGDEVTISFNWQIAKNGSLAFVYGNCRLEWVQGSTYLEGIKNPAMTFSAGNTAGYVTVTVKLNSTSINANKVRFRVDNSVLILKISNMKVEKGNKATSWTPAPEEYSTTTEMNSAITQTANEISSVVNQKVGYDELGTKIQQDYQSVQIAWNKISEYIQFINAQLQIKDANKKLLLALTQNGERFYNSGIYIGYIGTGYYTGDNSQKSLSFNLNENGKYMGWFQRSSSEGSFRPVLYYARANSFGQTNEGIYIEKPLYVKSPIYLKHNLHTDYNIYVNASIFLNEELRINSGIMRGSNGGYYYEVCFGDAVNEAFFRSNRVETNISGTLYVDGREVATNSSDARLKHDIYNSNINALDRISQIKHRKFIWNEDNKEEQIGYIAQELEDIDENYVIKSPQRNENGEVIDYIYQVNLLPILATATKAIQELKEEVDEIKEQQSKQQQFLEMLASKFDMQEEYNDIFAKETIKKSIKRAVKYDNINEQYNKPIQYSTNFKKEKNKAKDKDEDKTILAMNDNGEIYTVKEKDIKGGKE